ncbi:MAG: DUF6364 family protein [Candidatus Njordarchaeales archaeon]
MKKKLTLTVEAETVEKAKKKASEIGLPLSRIVENALKFFADPEVYCFSCGHRFKIETAEVCPKCGWYKCPKCGACGCHLGDEGAKVAFYMRKTLVEIFSRA